MNKSISLLLLFCIAFLLFLPVGLIAQVFHFSDGEQNHRIFMDDSYLIETGYQQKDGAFAFTRGGFYQKTEKAIEVTFEFNSNYAQDSLKRLSYTGQDWRKVSNTDQALEGKWLMAGRVKPQGEQRRDLSRSRKTMKLLLDGYFQWTAFDSASMRFMGSGGGTYTAQGGNYIETLEYFSRDNSKVGKVLPFEFSLKENDWYHKGLNSKGQSMHEIWQKRSNQ